ncbi:MAG: cytochrome-c peroxidase, partial [Bacteroidota bacterium]
MKLLITAGKVMLFITGYLALGYNLGSERLLPTADPLGLALEKTGAYFREDLRRLDASLVNYVALAESPQVPVNDLRNAHLQARKDFKKVEYLLAYIEPATVSLHLNGAPLPKTEPSVPEVNVIAPSGLQTLDELVFADEIDRKAILKVSKKLRRNYQQLQKQLSWLRLQHRHVFEAMQEEVVRIFTLGLTGFDTPGSGAALPEARVSLSNLRRVYQAYAPALVEKDPAINTSILAAFAVGEQQLTSDHFNEFDRLAFLRKVINPLTKNLPAARIALEIESSDDQSQLPAPTHRQPQLLFDEDFLDAAYYANLTESVNTEKRRELGELLFFDPVLSEDLTVSCASCHQPEMAFTDGYPKSLRATGEGTVLRNSPTLVNSVFAERYFYDLREEFLERQMMHVVADEHEFATDFVTLETRLKMSEEYRRLFAEAYADQPKYQLSKWSISDAISHYVASLQGLN